MANAQCFPRCPALPPTYVCVEMVTVKAGDTLYSISEEYNVPVPILMQANKILNPYNLKIGRRICIPGPVPENPVCVGILHTVVPFDTLYKISKKYHVSINAILEANPSLDPYNMQVGQKLCIPVSDHEVHLPEAGPNEEGCVSGAPAETPAQGQMGQTPVQEQAAGDPSEANIDSPVTLEAPMLQEAPPQTGTSDSSGNPAVNHILQEAAEEVLDELEDAANRYPLTYEVRDDDDLDSILRILQVSLETLLHANPKLSLNEILTKGTRLFLPQ
ncbi:MAG: LysM peptidoglycan-binding domain-containing protein [Firmicutes bacterium]|nr:LysM peptidoglycan-binding domain-containing protein [Bacillota bacterium]